MALVDSPHTTCAILVDGLEDGIARESLFGALPAGLLLRARQRTRAQGLHPGARRMTATTRNAGHLDAQPDAALPGEQEVLDRAAGENFSVASLVLGRRDARPPARDLRLRAARRPDRRRGRRRPARAARPRRGRPRPRLRAAEPEHPLLRRLAPTVRELDLPREPFQRLIEANRRDQDRPRTRPSTSCVGYCDLSANPVGELVLHVFGAATPERIALSDRVCTALQLAEHWQDVAEDFAARPRLPAGRGSRRASASPTPSSRRTRPAPRCARCSRSRSRGRASCSTSGAPLVGHAARPRAARGRRLRRRRAGDARRDRRGRLRRRSPARRGRAARRRVRQTLRTWRSGR